MNEEKIARINELSRKSKAEGLTEAEKQEQAILRQEFIASFRNNLKAQLDNIDVVNPDGSIENLGDYRKDIRKITYSKVQDDHSVILVTEVVDNDLFLELVQDTSVHIIF